MLRVVGGAAAPRAENAPLGHRCLLVTHESAPAPIRLHSTCFARVRSRARPKRATSTSASNLQSTEFHAAVAATSPASPSSGFERNLKTVIPTHLPDLLSMKCEVLAGAGSRLAVSGAGVHRGEGCGDAGERHPSARSGTVQRGVPEVPDETGEVGGSPAECGGGARQSVRLLLSGCCPATRSSSCRQIGGDTPIKLPTDRKARRITSAIIMFAMIGPRRRHAQPLDRSSVHDFLDADVLRCIRG